MSYKTQLSISPPLQPFSCHHSIDYSLFGEQVKFGPGSKISPLDNPNIFTVNNTQESLCYTENCLNTPQTDPTIVTVHSPRSPKGKKSPRKRSPRNTTSSNNASPQKNNNFEASKKPLNEEYQDNSPSYYSQTVISNLECEVLFTFNKSNVIVKSKFPKGSIVYKIILEPAVLLYVY